MRAEGWLVNHKKIQRLWREEGLRVPVRRRRKKTRNRHGRICPGRRRAKRRAGDRLLLRRHHRRPRHQDHHIVDEHTRVDAGKLAGHLGKLAAVRGFPRYLRCDNGPELISNALADWAKEHTEKEKTTITFIEPGAPWQNRRVESFNSHMRDECLKINDFGSLPEARVNIGDWRHA